MESNNKETPNENKNQTSNREVNEEAMKNIKKNLDGVISGYLEQFTNKFETFMGQMRIADVLLKAFEYRYDKIQGKIGNINDVLSYDYEKHLTFNQRCSSLVGLEEKMSTIEQKLGLIEQKIDGLLDIAQKKKMEENKEKSNENNETNERSENVQVTKTMNLDEFLKTENENPK